MRREGEGGRASEERARREHISTEAVSSRALAPALERRAGGAPPLVIALTAVVAAIALVFLQLGTGPLPVGPMSVLHTIFGNDPDNEFVVMDYGLPRGLLAILAGAAMGAAGAIMQSHTRNPLGTPDVIGFSSGAATAAVIALVPLHLVGSIVGVFAVVGGLLVALAVFALAGGAHRSGYRLIVIGIAATAVMGAITSHLLTRADVASGMDAQRWLAGSLNNVTWTDVTVIAVAAVLLVPVAASLRRPLLALQLGDETAIGLGVRARLVAATVVLVAVLLSAAVVMTVGPVSFVDLAAPQVALRLIRRPGAWVWQSAAVGAALLPAADLLALRAIPEYELPVGIATGVVGGVYLTWLLIRMWRHR